MQEKESQSYSKKENTNLIRTENAKFKFFFQLFLNVLVSVTLKIEEAYIFIFNIRKLQNSPLLSIHFPIHSIEKDNIEKQKVLHLE